MTCICFTVRFALRKRKRDGPYRAISAARDLSFVAPQPSSSSGSSISTTTGADRASFRPSDSNSGRGLHTSTTESDPISWTAWRSRSAMSATTRTSERNISCSRRGSHSGPSSMPRYRKSNPAERAVIQSDNARPTRFRRIVEPMAMICDRMSLRWRSGPSAPADVDELSARGPEALRFAGRQVIDIVDRLDVEAGFLEPGRHVGAVEAHGPRMAECLPPRVGFCDRGVFVRLGEPGIDRDHHERPPGRSENAMQLDHRFVITLDVLEDVRADDDVEALILEREPAQLRVHGGFRHLEIGGHIGQIRR